MSTADHLPPSLEMFRATCDVLGVPVGDVRVAAFNRLPVEVKAQVWREVGAPGKPLHDLKERAT